MTDMDAASPGSMAAQTTQTDLPTVAEDSKTQLTMDPTWPDTDSAARVEPEDRLWGLTVRKLRATRTALRTSARPAARRDGDTGRRQELEPATRY